MKTKQWYEELFENYAQKYDNEIFTHGTFNECNFIEQEIQYNKSLKILDVGCGTGRHSIELAKRGYKITGIDLSMSQLNRAKEKAKENNVKIDFFIADARDFNFNCEFDLVIMLCEGAFPLMETDEMNFRILQNVANSLNTKGKLIFTTLNGLFPIFNSIQDFCNTTSKEGNMIYKNNTFDLITFRDFNIAVFEDDLGIKKELHCNERYYIPSEITWLLKSLEFKTIDIFGAKLGAFSRNDKLTSKDFEMLIVAQK